MRLKRTDEFRQMPVAYRQLTCGLSASKWLMIHMPGSGYRAAMSREGWVGCRR